jgi:hypothetical protein
VFLFFCVLAISSSMSLIWVSVMPEALHLPFVPSSFWAIVFPIIQSVEGVAFASMYLYRCLCIAASGLRLAMYSVAV